MRLIADFSSSFLVGRKLETTRRLTAAKTAKLLTTRAVPELVEKQMRPIACRARLELEKGKF